VARDAVQEIKERLDLLDLIGESVRLQRSGRHYKGLCPFHSEKTPSFYVSAEKQLWHCYGCGLGGDHFTFVEQHEHLDFKGALEILARKAGVDLEEARGRRGIGDQKARILAINELAAQYYAHILLQNPAGASALRFLEGRGLQRATVEGFGVGFAPAADRRDNLLRFLVKRGRTVDEAVAAGLALRGDGRGDAIDRFRQRIMVPIRNERSELVGFGGRVLDDAVTPKYLNSPQTAVYDKSRVLFGLDRAKKAITERHEGVIVEGYFDCMMAAQAGGANTVASSGTALTEAQIKLLKHYAVELVFAFDADDAGRTATQRAVEVAARLGCRGRVVDLPEGKDPDEFLRRHPERWASVLEAAVPEWEHLCRVAMEGCDLGQLEGRRRALEQVIPVLAKIPEDSVLELYAQQVAAQVRVEAARVLRDVQSFRTHGVVSKRPAPPAPVPVNAGLKSAPAGKTDAGEAYVLGLLVNRPKLLAVVEGALSEDDFESEINRGLYRRLAELAREQPGAAIQDVFHRFSLEEQRALSLLGMMHYPELEGEDQGLRQSLEQSLQTLKLHARERARGRKLSELHQASDPAQRDLLSTEIQALGREVEELKGVRLGT
jgi:DNA primase